MKEVARPPFRRPINRLPGTAKARQAIYTGSTRRKLLSETSHEVTRLLMDWRSGNKAALDQLTPLVYAELRRLARGYLGSERQGHTLQPTALVHEAYMRLVQLSLPDLQCRSHFFGVAAQLMRQILVDHARRRNAAKRDAGRNVPHIEAIAIGPDRCADVVALDDALIELERIDARKARIVEMRFFGGLNVAETAEAVGASIRTIHRETKMAETWLYRRLKPPPAN